MCVGASRICVTFLNFLEPTLNLESDAASTTRTITKTVPNSMLPLVSVHTPTPRPPSARRTSCQALPNYVRLCQIIGLPMRVGMWDVRDDEENILYVRGSHAFVIPQEFALTAEALIGVRIVATIVELN